MVENSVGEGCNRKTCSNTYQRKRKGSQHGQELISSLTDDILVDILSLLDLRQAATTCVLSKRWRHVWLYLSDLDFDGLATLHTLRVAYYHNNRELHAMMLASEAQKFVHYVNHVLSSSLVPNVNRFRLRFQLGERYRDDIRTWLNFAMGKSVKELELDLSVYFGQCLRSPVCLDSFSCYAQSPSVHSLVSLSLVGVSISGSFLESVLLNFPNLERLKMKHLRCGHSNLKVVGDLLKLRYLEIIYCRDLGKPEISARNLISIVYRGSQHDVKYSYVPLLNEASFGKTYSLHMIRNLHHPGFGFLSQLTKLSLEIQDILQSPIELPQFGKLKQLELTFWGDSNKSLLVFTNFIDACPVLQKFKLKRIFFKSHFRVNKVLGGNVIKIAEKYHHCLNIFEMVGFRGAPADKELVLYLAQFGIVLEKVILDPHGPCDKGKPRENNTLEQIEATREQAKLLQNQLPARVQMKVL